MSVKPAAQNSSFIGFLRPGTGFPFSVNAPQLGLDYGIWDNTGTKSGQPLDDLMQQVVAGITGLDQTLIRPRWQEQPPNIPETAAPQLNIEGVQCWAAVGVTNSRPLGYPAEIERNDGAATGSGYDQQSDQEEFDVLCSFYGPLADSYAVLLRQGLMTAQNRECLQILNIGFRQTSGRTRVPSLVKERWLMRTDITAFFTREVRVFYPVLYFQSGPAEVRTDTGLIDPAPGLVVP